MTITEIMEKLARIKAAHGDVDCSMRVECECREAVFYDIGTVEFRENYAPQFVEIS